MKPREGQGSGQSAPGRFPPCSSFKVDASPPGGENDKPVLTACLFELKGKCYRSGSVEYGFSFLRRSGNDVISKTLPVPVPKTDIRPTLLSKPVSQMNGPAPPFRLR